MVFIRPLLVACILTALPALALLAQPGDGDPSYYHYFKTKQPLQLDQTRLAAYSPAGPSASRLLKLAEQAGIRDSKAKSHRMNGWMVLTMANASGTPALTSPQGGTISQLVDRMIGFDATRKFFLSPVFKGEIGDIVVSPEILVRLRPDFSGSLEELLGRIGASGLGKTPFGGMDRSWKLRGALTSGIQTLSIANQLAELEEVEWAEPAMIFSGRSALVPTDSGFLEAWGLSNIGQYGGTPDIDIDAPEAWDTTLGEPGVLTVIIDVGVEQTHPDINQVQGRDFTGDPNAGIGGPVYNCDNHGTPVAGVVSAVINGGGDAVGVAPGTRIASARVFQSNPPPCDGTWLSSAQFTVDALDWAVQIGARVTNNSNYYGFSSSAIAAKYDETRRAHGIIHFASAGNNYGSIVTYPASLPSVHAVSAVDRKGSRANFSNRGPEVDLSGPGVEIFTTDRTGSAGWTTSSYVHADGTSFAAPMAAGVAALLISRAPLLMPEEIQNLLEQHAMDLGPPSWDPDFGWGLVNAAASLVFRAGSSLLTETVEARAGQGAPTQA